MHATRLIFVWGSDDEKRSPKMQQLVRRGGKELIRRRVENFIALTSEIYASLVDHLNSMGVLRVPPFDTASCDDTTLRHLSRKRIEWFLETARRERNFPLKPGTATLSLLTHLNLLEQGKPTNAAILLFGNNPQRFHRTAETKCVHCHGTEYRRPFASQQIYSGDLFEQADQARDFVLAKINRTFGIRSESNVAPATYELPPDAVGEAIVNAIVHRDFQSLTVASRPTVKRDLEDLVRKGIFELKGGGRGSYYEFRKKRLINGSNGSSETGHKQDKQDKMRRFQIS